MTTSDAGTGPTNPSPPFVADGRRLVRRSDDRRIAGVCAALGAYTGIDPVIYRVVLAVLALFGGAGLALYGIGWLLIPELETGQAPVDALLRRPASDSDRNRSIATAVIVVLAVGVLLPLGHRLSLAGVALAALAVLGFLWLRDHRPEAVADGAASRGSAAVPEPAYGSTATVPLPPKSPKRPRSPLGWVTLGAAVVAVGLGLLLDAADLLHATLPGLLSTALLVISIGLIAGTWIGRARWLVLPALIVSVALAGATVISGVPLQGGTGDRFWMPTAADLSSEYRLAVGDATLDLTGLGTPASDRPLRASVVAGHLAVRLPAGVPVTVHARAGGGRVEVLGLVSDGFRVERDVFNAGTQPGGARLNLDLRIGAGELTVTRVAP